MSDCAICGGVGFEIVVRDDREFAKTCVCRVVAASKGPDVLERLRIPPRYRHCTIGNFEGKTPELRSAWEKAASFGAGYPHKGPSSGLGLLFIGAGSGVGKTHLAVAVLRELAETKQVFGQFWDYLELMRAIRSSYDPEVRMTEMEALEPIVRAKVLLLDDLGALRITDWMSDTLFYILNQRYVHERPTIITTNFDDKDPEQATRINAREQRDNQEYAKSLGNYGRGAPSIEPEPILAASSEYLVERVGPRLRSRLTEMCVLIRMKGTDHRAHRQHYNQAGALDGGR